MTRKTCSRCKTEKPLSDFYRDKGKKDGYQTRCKDCFNLMRSRSLEGVIARIEARAEKKAKAAKARTEAGRKQRREEATERVLAWRKANPGKANAIDSKRRALQRKALHPDHNKQREVRLFKLARRLERMTGEKWHVDHVVPLSQGGWHHHGNLQVIPAKWNLQKHDNPFWRPRKRPSWFRVPTPEQMLCGGV